jgi:hypothetical protein
MKRHTLHTGGVVGSIPTAPTTYPIEIIELYGNIVQLPVCGNLPQTARTGPEHRGRIGGSVPALFNALYGAP